MVCAYHILDMVSVPRFLPPPQLTVVLLNRCVPCAMHQIDLACRSAPDTPPGPAEETQHSSRPLADARRESINDGW